MILVELTYYVISGKTIVALFMVKDQAENFASQFVDQVNGYPFIVGKLPHPIYLPARELFVT